VKRLPEIRLLTDAEPLAAGCVVLQADVPFAGRAVHLRVQAPEGRARLADVVPLARAICDEFTKRVTQAVEAGGGRISCAKRCGVCCTNFLVPMSVPEAFAIMEDLQGLPLGERRRLEQEFAQAEQKLAESGLSQEFARLDPAEAGSAQKQRDLAGEWWSRQRFPCPLLRDDACGLYASRPIPCREFLAVSPPELCRTNQPTRVRRPFDMHTVLSVWAAELEGARPTLVLMANLLSWCLGKTTRAQRTWRAPGMVHRFLDVLGTVAARGEQTYQGPIPRGEAPGP
jgi:Fe-S-cluster containining protein